MFNFLEGVTSRIIEMQSLFALCILMDVYLFLGRAIKLRYESKSREKCIKFVREIKIGKWCFLQGKIDVIPSK